MKIGGKKPGSVGTDNFINRAGDSSNVKKNSGAQGGTSSSDNVDISSRARQMNRAKSLLDSVPDVRTEKVGRLKTDIERGNYHVDAGKVAERMIERAVRDALHKK
ncbi:MAG: flagellar biosynthesis anti-sigma factor FlgM [Deltaproteobacteria bacterium]|nr:flagellar biosynthesis anti-sigma factor FlgM [Deltaproteobacteria bacterium]